MLATKLRELASGRRGICLVAVTYVYFLIFAQFAFLHRLAQLDIADSHLQAVMAAMAAGGIAFSLLASRAAAWSGPRLRLQASFLLCAAAAALTLRPLHLPGSLALSFLIGSGLGSLTVTLVANLRLWTGATGAVWKVGIGTGIGYFLCNLPPLFDATPRSQTITAAALCLLGIFAASKAGPCIADDEHAVSRKTPSFALVVVAFTLLVWLDSAAFFIIQNTPTLKAGTWQGATHLWTNGILHFAAALASAYLLRRRGLAFVLAFAVLALSMACLLLHRPDQIVLASLFYPIGVSLYSVALVAYPSLLAPSSPGRQTAIHAGIIYAVAGWFGSAMGIGMGQHLRQVPLPFVLIAALLILGPALLPSARRHIREAAFIAAALALAFAIDRLAARSIANTPPASSAAERGRQVYIAEGCINCHSQYVRPHTADLLLWGPSATLQQLRSQRPPLIGNRRQGPDLSQVGGRRSPLWLEAHLFNPRELSHASFMPSYAHLFQATTRGDDLVQYLAGLRSPQYPEHIAFEQTWHPSAAAVAPASPDEGARLYRAYCATCHEAWGATRATWHSQFQRLPPDLQAGPLLDVPASCTGEARFLRFAQIIKFGIPGTDMPGHEYLSDRDVASISFLLNQVNRPLPPPATTDQHSGDSR